MSMNRAVFVTDQFGGKKLYDDLGLIGEFRDTYSNIVQGDDGIKKRIGKALWVMTLDNPKKIERARNYPGFGTSFKEVDKEPVFKTLNNIRTLTDPNAYNAEAVKKAVDENDKEKQKLARDLAIAERDKKQLAQDSRRWAELYSLLLKSDGNYKANANPELIAEFEKLNEKLGLAKEVSEKV